jgi:hypothetical protein
VEVRFWPGHAFEIDCDAPPEAASTRIATQVDPPGSGRSGSHPFQGHVRGHYFLVRKRPGRNGADLSSPDVEGRIDARGQGSRIRIEMKPTAAGLLLMALGAGFYGLLAISLLWQLLFGETKQWPALIALLVVPPLLWFGGVDSFQQDAREQERRLRDIFAAGGGPAVPLSHRERG